MNCARIIYANQVATNGVVHVIDRVISAVGNTMQDSVEVDDDLTTLSVSAQTGRQKYLTTSRIRALMQKWVTLHSLFQE